MTVPPAPDDDLRQAARAVASNRSSACPGEERILAFYAGELAAPQEDALRDHLASCARCVELGRDARRFLAAMGSEAAVARPAPRTRPWMLPLAASLTLLAAGVWGGRTMWSGRSGPPPHPTQSTEPSRPPANPWRDLVVEKAAYAAPAAPDLVFRDGGDASPPAPFERAMEPYASGDFGEAERRLGVYLAQRPTDARALFYRGASLLLAQRAEEAVPVLEAAARAREPIASEARWYLALAHLKAGHEAAALAALQVVERETGAHRAEAQALLQRLAVSR